MNYKWELRIMPSDYWEEHPNDIFAYDDKTIKNSIQIMRFETREDAYKLIGEKLKKKECGVYYKEIDGKEYLLMRLSA